MLLEPLRARRVELVCDAARRHQASSRKMVPETLAAAELMARRLLPAVHGMPSPRSMTMGVVAATLGTTKMVVPALPSLNVMEHGAETAMTMPVSTTRRVATVGACTVSSAPNAVAVKKTPGDPYENGTPAVMNSPLLAGLRLGVAGDRTR